MKLKIKKGDEVLVISGDSKGVTGVVLQIDRKKNRVVVDGCNTHKKHIKSNNDKAGGIEEIFLPIAISNVALIDKKTGQRTKVGKKEVDGKMVRFSKKSGEII